MRGPTHIAHKVCVRATTEEVIKLTVLAENGDNARLRTLLCPHQLEKYWLQPSEQQHGVGADGEEDGPSEEDEIQAALDKAPDVTYKPSDELLYMSYMWGCLSAVNLGFSNKTIFSVAHTFAREAPRTTEGCATAVWTALSFNKQKKRVTRHYSVKPTVHVSKKDRVTRRAAEMQKERDANVCPEWAAQSLKPAKKRKGNDGK